MSANTHGAARRGTARHSASQDRDRLASTDWQQSVHLKDRLVNNFVNIRAAKSRHSSSVVEASKGQSFVPTKASRRKMPLVPVVPAAAVNLVDTRRRLGSLAGVCVFPADIKAPFADDVDWMFNSQPASALTRR